MSILNPEKDWLEKNGSTYEVEAKFKVKIYNEDWRDFNSFEKDLLELAENYGIEVKLWLNYLQEIAS